MDRRLIGAGFQFALLVIGIPVVYLVAFPFGLTAKSLLPPLGLLAGSSSPASWSRKRTSPSADR